MIPDKEQAARDCIIGEHFMTILEDYKSLSGVVIARNADEVKDIFTKGVLAGWSKREEVAGEGFDSRDNYNEWYLSYSDKDRPKTPSMILSAAEASRDRYWQEEVEKLQSKVIKLDHAHGCYMELSQGLDSENEALRKQLGKLQKGYIELLGLLEQVRFYNEDRLKIDAVLDKIFDTIKKINIFKSKEARGSEG